MIMSIFQSVLVLGLSFSVRAAVSVIGPDGRVEVFYQEGDRWSPKSAGITDFGDLWMTAEWGRETGTASTTAPPISGKFCEWV